MNEIVAYWNGAQLRDLFESIVFIVGGSDFLGLLRTVAVFGLLIMTTMAVLRSRAIEPMAYIAALALFYSLMLVPKMSLTIKDVRSGNVYVVGNVPYGVGVFASAASHIGVWLTDTFEAAFAPADALKFSRFGVVYPERLVSSLQQLGPVTPQGREMLAGLMKDCVVPEMLDSSAKATEIINSKEIWVTIRSGGWLNAARYTVDLTGAPVSCPDHANAIDTYLTNVEIPEMQKYLGIRMLPDHANPSAAIATSLPQVEAQLLGMARSMQQSLTQSAMIDMVPKGVALAGASGQPLQVAMNLASSQANMASDINYKSMATVARDALPKVRNTVEFIIIASFPLMLIMVIAAGHYAGSMLRTYFVMLLWVQLWAPLYAVLNYLVISTDTNPLNQLITAYGGNTIASAGLIQEFGSSSSAIAGGLTVLVPIIAYYLASRAEIAATSMVSSLMQPAQQAGGAMAAQAAQGNVSMGNVSWGNVSTNNASSNKDDRSIGMVGASTMKTSDAYGGTSYQGDGSGGVTRGEKASLGAFGATSQVKAEAGSGTSSSEGLSAQRVSESLFESGRSAVFGALTDANFARQLQKAVGFEAGSTRTGATSQTGGQNLTATTGTDTSTSGARRSDAVLSSGAGASGGVNFNAGVSSPGASSGKGFNPAGSSTSNQPLSASGQVSAGGRLSTSLAFNDAVSNAIQTSRKDGSSGEVRSGLSVEDLRRASLAVEASSGDQQVKRAGQQFREGLDRVDAARTVERASLSSSMESRKVADRGISNSVGLSRDDAAAIQAFARAEGMSDADLRKASAVPESPEGRRLERIAERFYAGRAGDGPGGVQSMLGQTPSSPLGQGDVAQYGSAQQAEVGRDGNAAVTNASARNKAQVASQIPFSARSGPENWDGVVGSVAGSVQGTANQVANRQHDAQYLAAGSSLADYLNRDQTNGSSAPFKLLGQNSPFAGQLGFRAPEDAIQAMDRVYANGSDTDRMQILRLGQDLQSGQATPERVRDTLQYVESRDRLLNKSNERPQEEASKEYALP